MDCLFLRGSHKRPPCMAVFFNKSAPIFKRQKLFDIYDQKVVFVHNHNGWMGWRGQINYLLIVMSIDDVLDSKRVTCPQTLASRCQKSKKNSGMPTIWPITTTTLVSKQINVCWAVVNLPVTRIHLAQLVYQLICQGQSPIKDSCLPNASSN